LLLIEVQGMLQMREVSEILEKEAQKSEKEESDKLKREEAAGGLATVQDVV
jgi:hypothetical protein